MIGFYDYTVIATYIELAFAVAGIFFAFENMPGAAICALLVCGFLDMFDGKIARTKKNRTSDGKRFGIQIDSLCDLISFGVLPSSLCLCLSDKRLLCLFIVIGYTLAALIRLAYFNVTEENRQTQTDSVRKVYTGLPVTSSALVLPFVWTFEPLVGEYIDSLFLFFTSLMGVLFITPIKIKKAGMPGMVLMALFGVCVFAVLCFEKANELI